MLTTKDTRGKTSKRRFCCISIKKCESKEWVKQRSTQQIKSERERYKIRFKNLYCNDQIELFGTFLYLQTDKFWAKTQHFVNSQPTLNSPVKHLKMINI